MYAVSEAYKYAMKQAVQRFRMTGTFGNFSFTDENILKGSMSIVNQCSDNAQVSIGQVYTAELNVTLIKTNIARNSTKPRIIKPYFGLCVDEEENTYEDIPLGVFNVQEANWTATGIVVKAYDNMCKLDKGCTVGSTNGLPFALAEMACTACNLTLGTTASEFSHFVNGSQVLALYTDNDIETWRDWLSWVAQAVGCNVMADREGKIIFRPYNQDIVDVIDVTNRHRGGSVSDFVTYYTGISCVNIEEQTTSYYSTMPDDGLAYNLGSNPFLQYGVDAQISSLRRNILIDGLGPVRYVPFTFDMIGNPAYDLMDVFSFPGGIGDDTKLFCMTKYVFNYHGKYSMQGVGANPALATARSKTDKEISGLSKQSGTQLFQYVVFNNASEVVISDGEYKQIMNIQFAVQKTSHVEIDMEILLDAETTEIDLTGGHWSETDVEAVFSYFLNGEEVLDRHPVQTWFDGEHVLRLRYDLASAASQIHQWEVWLKSRSGTITIPASGILAVISGTGIVSNDWDGVIMVTDTVGYSSFETLAGEFTDEADVDVLPPVDRDIDDDITMTTFVGMFTTISDAGIDQLGMIFSPWTNADKVVTACEYNNEHGWLGSGTILGGDALTLTTMNVSNVTSITSNGSNVSFLISFDGGSTFKGYADDQWVDNAYMDAVELAAIPSEEFEGETIKVRAFLETDDWLYNLNLYGGTINA